MLDVNALVKHLQGQHDQSEHGVWAQGREATEDLFRGVGSLDLDALSEYQEISDMSDEDYVDEYMNDEFNTVRERLLADKDSGWSEADEGDLTDEIIDLLGRPINQHRTDEIEALKKEIFDDVVDVYSISGVLPDGRDWTAMVDNVQIYQATVEVDGRFEVEGEEAGHFERTVSAHQAYRALLVIEDEYAGTGIASVFNESEELSYAKSGVGRVVIDAMDLSHGDFNTPPGTYVWASQGYGFSYDAGYEVQEAVFRYINENPEYDVLPEKIRETVDDVANRLVSLQPDAKDYPTPREISQLGRLPGSRWWAGKSVMAHGGASEEEARSGDFEGPSWDAVKSLSVGIRMSLGEVRSQQARAETAVAVEQHLAALRARSPSLGSDPEFIMINGQPVPIEPTDASVRELVGAGAGRNG